LVGYEHHVLLLFLQNAVLVGDTEQVRSKWLQSKV
jgi:hypothetical protein